MPHYLSHDTETGAVTGFVKTSRGPLTLAPRHPGEAYVEVTLPEHIALLSTLNPGSDRLQARIEGPVIHSLKAVPVFSGSLELTCDALDLDGDGVAELAADGHSEARVRASLVGHDRKPLPSEGLEVAFRVTRGSLSDRHPRVRGAEAEVQWRASTETVRAEVTATAQGFKPGHLVLEFVPPVEHQRMLSAATGKKS